MQGIDPTRRFEEPLLPPAREASVPKTEKTEENIAERLREALESLDHTRNDMMDRHHELVARSQKLNLQRLRKKLAEQRIRQAEEREDLLQEQALVERLNARSRLEADALRRSGRNRTP